MILEVALLYVKPEFSLEFEEDFKKASLIIQSINGYKSHSLHKCMEMDNKYILLVNWQSLESHTINFRQSPLYFQWKKILHHYYDPFPNVEHYQCLYKNGEPF